MTLYGGFNSSVPRQTGPTEEEKRRDAEHRARFRTRLRVYMGVQLFMAVGMLVIGVTGVIFHNPDSTSIPFFIGPFISTPVFFLGAYGSFSLVKTAKDVKEGEQPKNGCGSLILQVSVGLAVTGCATGVAFAAMTAFPYCEDYLDDETEECNGYTTTKILAIVTMATSLVALAVALFSIYFFITLPVSRRTQIGTTQENFNRQQLVLQLQRLNEQMQQPSQGFSNMDNTQLANVLLQMQRDHELALQSEQGRQQNFSNYGDHY